MDIRTAELVIDATIRDRHDEAVRQRDVARARQAPSSRHHWWNQCLSTITNIRVQKDAAMNVRLPHALLDEPIRTGRKAVNG
jgi:hypothetical protein